MATTSLLDWILSILRDPDQRAAFQHDPDDYARDHGFSDLSSADVHDALLLIGDNQSASYDHQHSVHYPPPQHYDNHEHAGHYLNHYITNNYKVIDEHDTNIDNSVHQKVNTHGGDFHQSIDNDPVVASGHGSVAVGHDANGNISSAGHDNTTAFGDGDATHASFDHADFGSGSGVSLSGNAEGHADDNSTTTSVHGGHGDTSVQVAGTHAVAHQFVNQSETDNSQHFEQDDHSHTDSHNETDSHNPVHTHDGDHVELHHI
ncbi:MAG: IniB N-terminal domain-containing protein [Pseudonocardia sp.]